MKDVIFFFSPDGFGKTTLIRSFLRYLSTGNIHIRISWLRGSHTFASILARLSQGLRYFTAYDPRQRPDMVFHRFVKAMLKNEPVQIYGDGSQIRYFTYVEDVVEATILVMEVHDDRVLGEAINIGGGRRNFLTQISYLVNER